ncbi:alpha/beta fold hydrolase [Gelidibacter salicanalis]|uniref:Alpha/beta fold hydrolase n=1 Tax=Gelidibacter salicanalis TaxID=291193 RepID=A0A5C7AIX8_9FLAO|nr:alpha/beta fold hydrolase [Gelidibacter salicanalis]TXE08351.1 alpha/beta fold hydrolase [Gelidibacter salicanalis]
MKIHKNNILNRTTKKPILWDAFYKATETQKPMVIFCHGYKGFKDWGAWDLVAKAFAEADLFFVKFNFSHNGGTMEQPIDFPDLEAFAENNYSKELDDLEDLITFLRSTSNPFQAEINPNNLVLIGHSRGGGIVTLKASEDDRITKVISWAGVSDFGQRTATSGELEQWKKEGVKYVLNGRTKQQMPHNYQFYEDFKANERRLHIEKAVKKIKIPHLIIHAKDDPSVAFTEAEALHSWNNKSLLLPIDNSDHVFGASHPWQFNHPPAPLKEVIQKSLAFITS